MDEKQVVVEQEIDGHMGKRRLIPETTMASMRAALCGYTNDQWNDSQWNVFVPISQRSKTIRFPECVGMDADILRASVLLALITTASVDYAQRIAREGGLFLGFLSQKGISIENIRTAIVVSYINLMEKQGLSESVIYSRVRSARNLFDCCIQNGIVSSSVKVLFEYCPPRTYEPKRPPDASVTDALDRLVFNLSEEEIPLIFKTLYLLIRMIPSRISELLSMNVRCIKYLSEKLYTISIPTSKETTLHKPEYKNYHFSLDGRPEQLLHECICRLNEKNSKGDDLTADVDYLFYDDSLGRVLSKDDFNSFLFELVNRYKILNDDGSIPTVSSHTFRHVDIGERLRSGVFSIEETMEEAGHVDPNVTLAYGCSSRSDEAKRLERVLSGSLGKESEATYGADLRKRVVPPQKYYLLQENVPFIRQIPIHGLCDNSSCHPQYAQCINCDSFQPDPFFLDYFKAVEEIISKRLKLMETGGAEEAIQFEKYELAIVKKYIQKIEKRKELEEQDGCDFDEGEKELATG